MAKIKCRKPRRPFPDCGTHKATYWPKALPFVLNPRAILVHRVQCVATHWRDGERSHDSVKYWCWNSGHGELLAEPPRDRLLCAECEARAVANGEKPASEIVGRHVHVGRLRAERTCCRTDRN